MGDKFRDHQTLSWICICGQQCKEGVSNGKSCKILKPDPYLNREHHQYAERNRVCPNGTRRANSSSHQCSEGLSKTYHPDAHHSEK